MKIMIIGHKGMLGSDIMKSELTKSHSLVWVDRTECDITSIGTINQIFDKLNPDLIINCSAYTAVDLCESKEWWLVNFQVNVIWVRNIAQACESKWIPMIHISTDYIFEGSQEDGYWVKDKANPINMYGMAKLLWEYAIEDNCSSYHIIRTSWLYGWWDEHTNFIKTMIKLMSDKNEIKVVSDQYWAPTSTQTLIQHITNIINNDELWWVISHCTDKVEKAISRFEFASEIKDIIWSNCNVIPCTSDEFPRPAKRPNFSLLICDESNNSWEWKSNVRDYIESSKHLT